MAHQKGLGTRALLGAWVPVLQRLHHGEQFAGLLATSMPEDATRLTVLLAGATSIEPYDVVVDDEQPRYEALTPLVPAATWYERAIADLHGLVPVGHPRRDPLVLPLRENSTRPRPGGRGEAPMVVLPEEEALPAHVHGTGMFIVTHGPVRSGITESVEYLVETPGEDIPHLRVRVFAKHRGVQARFSGLAVEDGVLLAERAEGIASVAHALAFSEAVEKALEIRPPRSAALVRALHAELERVANHIDVAMRLSDAAGLAVATARLGSHKERVLRLVSALCGSRFGRGVVLPGGVTRLPLIGGEELLHELHQISSRLLPDLVLLMRTPSFLDRLRGTGVLSPEFAAGIRALGPVGRASGVDDDNRITRPYAAYHLVDPRSALANNGDAQDRLTVRVAEIRESLRLIREFVRLLDEQVDDEPLVSPLPGGGGRGVAWAEAPQGEVVYDVEVADHLVVRASPRSASFHNLSWFHDVFHGDVFTDFPFIEASFGISIAGVVM